MFQIKICGITSVEDALLTAHAGADAIGLNFYSQSPRCIKLDVARQMIAVLPPEVIKVGLFVNAPAEQVATTFDDLGLDMIQLHGDETPELLAELAGRPIVRAFRVGQAGLPPVIDYLEACSRLGCVPRMVLLDAYRAGHYGGTGQPTDWNTALAYRAQGSYPPLVLAGGLTPDNVAEAVHTVQPAAVDTASGVETRPGAKDPARVEQFVQAARKAFGG